MVENFTIFKNLFKFFKVFEIFEIRGVFETLKNVQNFRKSWAICGNLWKIMIIYR